MRNENGIVVPESVKPNTKSPIQPDADLAHEQTLEYFVHNTELGIVSPEQMGVISLIDAGQHLGIYMPATSRFFERQRQLSSGEEGKGRIQVKEVITAGSFPMSLLFGEQKSGILDVIKGFMPGKKTDTQRAQ
jgi:hypothetical protein